MIQNYPSAEHPPLIGNSQPFLIRMFTFCWCTRGLWFQEACFFQPYWGMMIDYGLNHQTVIDVVFDPQLPNIGISVPVLAIWPHLFEADFRWWDTVGDLVILGLDGWVHHTPREMPINAEPLMFHSADAANGRPPKCMFCISTKISHWPYMAVPHFIGRFFAH